MRESVLSHIIVCPVCHTSYIEDYECCDCPKPMYEDAEKQAEWHDKLTELDHV